MKILFVGDTHASIPQWDTIQHVAEKNRVDLIWQVGDFGYKFTPGYIKKVQSVASELKIPVYWTDGNHDDHSFIEDRLDEIFPNCPYCDGDGLINLGSDGTQTYYKGCTECTEGEDFIYPAEVALWPWAPDVLYMPRGSTVELDGKTFMSVGGAFSIDKDLRVPYVEWWPQETISQSLVNKILNKKQDVDVIVSHDGPNSMTLKSYLNEFTLADRLERGSEDNRGRLMQIIDHVEPELIVHGHYHYRYDELISSDNSGPYIKVVGLDCTGSEQFWIYDGFFS